jgi:ligand-binding sensor domain-containing protein
MTARADADTHAMRAFPRFIFRSLALEASATVRALRLCLLSLLGVCLIPVQTQALTPSKVPSQYVLDSWQLDKGLPQNSPQSLAQTPDGYIWVGTQEGLARFDGVRFVVFNRRNVPQFSSHFITALRADRRGRLWIGTSAGPVVLEGDQFKNFGVNTPLASAAINDIMEDARGDISTPARSKPSI